jgi:hypothetical protein
MGGPGFPPDFLATLPEPLSSSPCTLRSFADRSGEPPFGLRVSTGMTHFGPLGHAHCMRRKKKRKSCWDFDKEKIAAADTVLRETKRLPRDPEKLLATLATGNHVRPPLRSEQSTIAKVFAYCEQANVESCSLLPHAETLRDLVAFCIATTDLLTDQEAPSYANALLALSGHCNHWLRPLRAWSARTHNAYRQFRSLVRHLLARYDVPAFLDTAWLEGLTPEAVKYQGWFKLIGDGRNIRTAGDLPFALTKKQAHHFLQAPGDIGVVAAFRWAHIMDLGGDERLVRSILGTRIGTDFENASFWTSVLRFFIARPGVDPRHHGPIIDFLHDQRFVPSVPNPRAGEPGQPPLVPPHPNLSMKGRSAESLLRAVGRWHQDLWRPQTPIHQVWEWSGFPSFAHEDGVADNRRVYEITELTSRQELLDEGAAMGHCVASYAHACVSRYTSIWALRERIEGGRVIRLVTLEVKNNQRMIVQARKRGNRLPTGREWSILRRWSEAGGPRVARGLGAD